MEAHRNTAVGREDYEEQKKYLKIGMHEEASQQVIVFGFNGNAFSGPFKRGRSVGALF